MEAGVAVAVRRAGSRLVGEIEAAGSRRARPVLSGSRGGGPMETVYMRKAWTHSRLAAESEISLWCIMGDRDRVVGGS